MKLSQHRAIWRPYTQEKTQGPPIHVDHAEGAYIFSSEGQKIFDGISSWWLITHGHCHPQIVEAIQSQVSRLDQVVFANFTHAPAEELADLLVKMTPSELTRVFLSDNGSTAIEVALKMAIQACAQRGQENKKTFLAFSKAYHGDTVGAMSVSDLNVYNQPYVPLLFDVLRVPQPQHSQSSIESFVQPLARLLEFHHQKIAAVIVEPLIQGAGGMIVWPDEAIRQIAKLCQRYGVYLVFDEVMTGFGRTGSLFAMDRLNVVPDFVCLSKGLTGGTLPLAATLVREEIYQAFYDSSKSKMFFHGHSFTGNPISCAAAVASLKLYQDPEYTRRFKSINLAHQKNLEVLKTQLPLRDVRLCGTMAAIELETSDGCYTGQFSTVFMQKALAKGLFVRPLGDVIYLLPPYCATPQEIEWAWSEISEISQNLLGGGT